MKSRDCRRTPRTRCCQKEAADASALMYISFYSEQMNNPQITDYLSRVIQPKLATLPGIAEAEILGNQVFAMRLWLDPVKMAAFGVTAGEINQAVQQYNFLAAAGEVKGRLVVTSVNASTDLQVAPGLRRHPGEDRRRPPEC
ncbi:efflux RND transporter permease subunit [Pseudomonas aeruginosa]